MFLRVLLENQVHFQLDTTFHANNNSDLCVWGLCCFTLANPRPDDGTTSWKLLEPVDPWACGTVTHLSFRAPGWNISFPPSHLLLPAVCHLGKDLSVLNVYNTGIARFWVLRWFFFFFFLNEKSVVKYLMIPSYNKEMGLLWWFHYLWWF